MSAFRGAIPKRSVRLTIRYRAILTTVSKEWPEKDPTLSYGKSLAGGFPAMDILASISFPFLSFIFLVANRTSLIPHHHSDSYESY